MSGIEIFGWVCAFVGTVGFLPQPIKLLRDRNTAGLSLRYWQLMSGAVLGWAVHGVLVAKYNILVPNIIVTSGALLTIWLIKQARELSYARAFGPALILGVALVSVELSLGEAAFGTAAAIPGVIAILSQLVDVIREPDVSGVSGLGLFMGAVLQAFWLTWGVLYPDIATAISASIMTTLFVITFGWFLARSAGAKALFVP